MTVANRLKTTLLLRHDFQSLTPAEHPAIEIETLPPAGIQVLADINPEIERQMEEAKFAEGCVCYIARVDGRSAHYSWVQDSGVHKIAGTGRTRRVRPGELWIHACFTADWARGRGIYPAVLTRILRDYSSRGFTTAWIYVLDSNVPSRKGIERAGFRMVSRLRAVLVRRWTVRLP